MRSPPRSTRPVLRFAIPETIRGAVDDLSIAPIGRVVVRERSGKLFEVVAGDALRLPPPDLPRRQARETLAFNQRGILWVVQGGGVAYLEARGAWRRLPGIAFEGEQPLRVKPHAGGGVLLATDAGTWHVLLGSAPSKLCPAPSIDMISLDPERVLGLAHTPAGKATHVVEITREGERVVLSPESLPNGRPISLTQRNGTVWIAIDRFLMALHPGEPPELMGKDSEYESGGPILVDREGNLWVGSSVGLHQYPEPDTRLWGGRDRLLSRHTRFLARTGDALWVATWAGTGYLHRSAVGWTVGTLPWDTRANLCSDAAGAAWTTAAGAVLEIRDTLVVRWPSTPVGMLYGCTPARDGGVWLGVRGRPSLRGSGAETYPQRPFAIGGTDGRGAESRSPRRP